MILNGYLFINAARKKLTAHIIQLTFPGKFNDKKKLDRSLKRLSDEIKIKTAFHLRKMEFLLDLGKKYQLYWKFN